MYYLIIIALASTAFYFLGKEGVSKPALFIAALMFGGMLFYPSTASAKDYHVMVADVRGNDPNIANTLLTLYKATPDDHVYVHVLSYGGSVRTMYAIIAAIENSKGETTTIVESHAMSAGVAIALAGDNIVIKDDTEFMIHMASRFGQLIPLDDPVYQNLFKRVDKYYSIAFSDDEIKRMLSGEDVFVKGEVVRERLKNPENLKRVGTLMKLYKKALAKKKLDPTSTIIKRINCYTDKPNGCPVR